MNFVREEPRDISIYSEVDVLVVGGGPAGFSAAVAAARAGARTAIVEHHGFLGGMWTAGMVLTLAGYNSWLRPYDRCVKGIPEEWVLRAAEQGGARNNSGFVINSDPEVMKRVADEMVCEENIEFLFHTWGATPIMDGTTVKGAFIENVDGRRAILAKVTIDCTGNGDFVERSGAAWVKADSLQPMTMSFIMSNAVLDAGIPHDGAAVLPIGPEAGMLRDPILTDYSSVRRDVPVDAQHMRDARDRGALPTYGGPWFGGLRKDTIWVNSTRVYGDASNAKELSYAEATGRRDTKAISEYFQKHVDGLQDSRLVQTSTQIGVRETRRMVGAYTLTGDDIRSGVEFADSVAVGCWPIDVHPSERQVGTHAMYVPKPFDIPYRILLPESTDGLLAAGRCVSTDREALGSVRVGATCAAMGQAAGAAAAIAAEKEIEPRHVDVSAVQRLLEDQGALVFARSVMSTDSERQTKAADA